LLDGARLGAGSTSSTAGAALGLLDGLKVGVTGAGVVGVTGAGVVGVTGAGEVGVRTGPSSEDEDDGLRRRYLLFFLLPFPRFLFFSFLLELLLELILLLS
jgi:hypothetical protein